ncbi:macrophage mannose receptor 1 [Plakobranchus ocellatus]|uniref:Macrophage mannose receptor 1 n=1 Tax=Plakobranchus ocellatus TaxID=259542 RepID=A0AAV4DZ17_9GAST|nr:macrophage mannose receptor 1 [Plakobranchus ocellatus]
MEVMTIITMEIIMMMLMNEGNYEDKDDHAEDDENDYHGEDRVGENGDDNESDDGQDCADLWIDKWNDESCPLQQAFICERPPRSAAPGECEPEWLKIPSSGTCKHWYAERKSWKDAKAFCRQQGGDLVTILDGQTNKIVDELRTSEKGGRCWIGLNDLSKEGEFVWPNNQKVAYKNWDVDPRKSDRNGIDCVVMGYRGTEKWSLFY